MYINLGLPQTEWVIIKHPTGRLEDLGFVTLQEQLAVTETKQVAPIGQNRVLVKRSEDLLHLFNWGDRELGVNGGFTGRVVCSDKIMYLGEAAYALAKSARKLADF